MCAWKSGSLVVSSVGGAFCILAYFDSMTNSALRESPKDAHNHSHSSRPPLISLAALNEYKRNGVVVIDNVLTQGELLAARTEVNDLLHRKLFAFNDNDDAMVRGDVVCSIAETYRFERKQVIGVGLLEALRAVRAIPLHLGGFGVAECDMGVPFVNQLACYDGNLAHYNAHRDAPELIDGSYRHPLSWLLQPGLDERQITIILYLNDSVWDSSSGGLEDSGHLKVYLHTLATDMTGTSARSTLSIQPIGGRMVIFDSRRVLHEVRPSHQRRSAITCWVGGRHSINQWVRPLCIPIDEIDWAYVRFRYLSS